MRVPWRVTVLASVLVPVFVATIPGVSAQGGPPGGGGLLPAGTYNSTSLNANFAVGGSYPAPQISISATKTTNVSKPKTGPSTTTSETDVFVSVQDYTNSIFGGGCFILDHPADFNLAGDLSSASLHTTITSTTPTCFGPGSLPFPFSIDVAWKGTGPIATFQDESRYQCLTYKSETATANRNNIASANATLSGFSTPLATSQSGLGLVEQRVQAEGVGQSSCPPGGTKGTGAGPLTAGSYHISGPQMDAFFGTFPGPGVYIAVNDITQVSHPVGSREISTREIDLNVQMFGGAVNGAGCWVISPSDFTSTGVTAASLQASITDTTPTCPSPFPNSLPLPMTVQASWSGTGPVVTVRDENVSRCLGFSEEIRSVNQSNNATASATVTVQQSTSTLSAAQASLVTGDQRIQVEGVNQTACIVR